MMIEGRTLAKTNGTTPVDAVPAPASGVRRIVRAINLFNHNSTDIVATLAIYDGTSTYVIARQRIEAERTCIFVGGLCDMIVLTDTDSVQISLGASPGSEADIVAAWADVSDD